MDAAAGHAAYLGGIEIVNGERVCAYLNAGIKPSGLQVHGNCCSCGDIRTLAGCDPNPYTTPANDKAPWYDAAIPESADFAGFLPIEFNGLGSTATRNIYETIAGGAVLGRLRLQSRQMTWRGLLLGRTCCAVAYGLRWLTAQLTMVPCDTCQGEDLDILVCCPDVTGITSCAVPSLPAPVVPTEPWRTLKNVGLQKGPDIISERSVSCGCGCNVVTEIEFTLVAGKPWLYKTPVDLGPGCQPFPIPNPDCPTFVKVIDGQSCPDTSCPEVVPCTEDLGICPTPTLPVVPVLTDTCFCDPLVPTCNIFTIPKGTFGSAFEGVPIIKIFAGNKPMRGVTVRFFENPQQRPCSEIILDPCLACDELKIRYIPKNATFIIDGMNRTITLDCPGIGDDVGAEQLTVSPFKWPTLQCIDYCICIEADAFSLAHGNVDPAEDACAAILVAPREP